MMNNILNIKSTVDNKIPISYAKMLKSKKPHHHSVMFKTVSPPSHNTTAVLGTTTSPTVDTTLPLNDEPYPIVMATSSPE
jgi:hypothetical protein